MNCSLYFSILFVISCISFNFIFSESYAEQLEITQKIKIEHIDEEIGVESGEKPNEIKEYIVTFNDVRVYYDTIEKNMIIETTIINHGSDGVYRILVDEIEQDSLVNERIYANNLGIISKNQETVDIIHPVENFDNVMEFSIRISPPSTSKTPMLALDKVDFFIPKLTMDYLFETSVISDKEIPYSIIRENDYALLTLDNSDSISKDEVIQVVYDGDSKQCTQFQFLNEDNVIKTIDASNRFQEIFYTNSDGGFEKLKVKCLFEDKSFNLQSFLPAAFGFNHAQEFSISDKLHFYLGVKTNVGNCVNCIFINIEPIHVEFFIDHIFEITLTITIPISIIIAAKILKKKK